MLRLLLFAGLRCITRAAPVAALLFTATAAFAQFAVSAAGTPSGPGSCDIGHASVPMTGGSLTLNLPSAPNNLINTSRVNGIPEVPVVRAFTTSSNAVLPEPSFDFDVLPPTSPPYTMIQEFFPGAVHGAATATGVTFTVTCNAAGEAALTFVNGMPIIGGPASTAVPVPGLSSAGLIALMALVAATPLTALPRRRGVVQALLVSCAATSRRTR